MSMLFFFTCISLWTDKKERYKSCVQNKVKKKKVNRRSSTFAINACPKVWSMTSFYWLSCFVQTRYRRAKIIMQLKYRVVLCEYIFCMCVCWINLKTAFEHHQHTKYGLIESLESILFRFRAMKWRKKKIRWIGICVCYLVGWILWNW